MIKMADLTIRSLILIAVSIGVFACVPVASALAISLQPDQIQPGQMVTVNIQGLDDGSNVAVSFQATVDVIPGASFNFTNANFVLPFLLNNGGFSVVMENTKFNRFVIVSGGTTGIKQGYSKGGKWNTSSAIGLPSGMYERIELSGDAANSAKNVVATFEISGVKQGPANSKITFFVHGMQSGRIKVTVSVNGQLAFDDTVTVGRPTAQTGRLSVTSVPSGADISVDGVYAGKTPLVINRVATGVRTVLFSKQGYSPVEKEVNVRQNDIIAVSETLVKNTGTLRVISVPSRATVLVQKIPGNSVKSQSDPLTPATYKYLEPGLYYVMVSRTNCTPQTKIVTITAGKTTVASFLLDCTQKEPKPGIVKTDVGYVSGLQSNGLWVYLGIPFADPPTGRPAVETACAGSALGRR
jgi:hypothetical protein